MILIIIPILLLVMVLLFSNKKTITNNSEKIHSINKNLEEKNILMKSTSSLEIAIYCERLYVQAGIKSVQREIEIQSYKSKSPEHARIYEQSSLEVENMFKEFPAENSSITIEKPPQFEAPLLSCNSNMNEKICQRINTMKFKHEEWLLEQFKFLQRNPSMEYKFWNTFDESGQYLIKENILKLFKEFSLKAM